MPQMLRIRPALKMGVRSVAPAKEWSTRKVRAVMTETVIVTVAAGGIAPSKERTELGEV